MNKIKRVSRIFKIIFQLVFIGFLLLTIVGWIDAPEQISILKAASSSTGFKFLVIPDYIKILHTLSPQEKIYGFLISTIPLAINLWLIASLIKLFKLYEHGKIFVFDNVKAIKHIGIALLLAQIISPFYEAALSAALTWHNPPGHRVSMASFNGTNVGLLTAAIIILLISWVMTEACKLKQENEMVI